MQVFSLAHVDRNPNAQATPASRADLRRRVAYQWTHRPQVAGSWRVLVSGDARFLSWGRRRETASDFPGATRRPLPLEISGRRVCHDPGRMVAGIRPDTTRDIPNEGLLTCVRDDGRPAAQCDKRCWLHRRLPRPVSIAVRDLADVTTVWTAVMGSTRSRLPVLFTSVRQTRPNGSAGYPSMAPAHGLGDLTRTSAACSVPPSATVISIAVSP